MRRVTIFIAVLALGLLSAVPALAAQPAETGSPIVPDAIWADGELRGTILIGEPGSLRYNGNDKSYDRLFLVDGQEPVSEAAPGNKDYNGGRWIPTPVSYDGSLGTLESYEDLMAAVDAGVAHIGDAMTHMAFLCPVIPNH